MSRYVRVMKDRELSQPCTMGEGFDPESTPIVELQFDGDLECLFGAAGYHTPEEKRAVCGMLRALGMLKAERCHTPGDHPDTERRNYAATDGLRTLMREYGYAA